MIHPLLQHLERAESGLFIHAPEGTCQQIGRAHV